MNMNTRSLRKMVFHFEKAIDAARELLEDLGESFVDRVIDLQDEVKNLLKDSAPFKISSL